MVAAAVSANPLKLDVRSHLKCLGICFIATIASFQYGLDYALVGGFLSMPGFLKIYGYYDSGLGDWNIDTEVQQLISSLMTIGTLIGSLIVGPFSSHLGRRAGLWSASLLNAIATAIMLGTTSLGALYFARLLLGISVGWFLTFSQLYVHEVAPAHLRGVTFAVYQGQLSIGSIVGASVDFGTHTMEGRRAYQIPLAIFYAAPLMQSVALLFFPETPRWLMVQGKEGAAEKSLRQLRNRNIDELQLQAELNEIRGSTREQLEQNKKSVFLEMWRGTNRRRTLLCIAVVCFHAGNGSSWVNIYTTYYLTIAGVQDPFGYSIMMTCMGLLGVLFSVFFVRYVDRRVILLVGTFACGICQLVQAVTWSVSPGSTEAGNVVVAFIALFTFFYVAYAPYAWLLGGEYPNTAIRGYAFGFATALNFLGNWLGTLTAAYFINPAARGWSARYGYIWFGSNMILFMFTWFFIPETRGRQLSYANVFAFGTPLIDVPDRTLEEIHEMFEAKLPARKFKGYVCTGVERYAADAVGEKNAEKVGAVQVERVSGEA